MQFIFSTVVVGRFFMNPSDAFGFSLYNYYIILHMASLAPGIAPGIKDGYLKWLFPVISGAFGIAVPGLIFGLYRVDSVMFAGLPEFLGVPLGTFIIAVRNRVQHRVQHRVQRR